MLSASRSESRDGQQTSPVSSGASLSTLPLLLHPPDGFHLYTPRVHHGTLMPALGRSSSRTPGSQSACRGFCAPPSHPIRVLLLHMTRLEPGFLRKSKARKPGSPQKRHPLTTGSRSALTRNAKLIERPLVRMDSRAGQAQRLWGLKRNCRTADWKCNGRVGREFGPPPVQRRRRESLRGAFLRPQALCARDRQPDQPVPGQPLSRRPGPLREGGAWGQDLSALRR